MLILILKLIYGRNWTHIYDEQSTNLKILLYFTLQYTLLYFNLLKYSILVLIKGCNRTYIYDTCTYTLIQYTFTFILYCNTQV